MKKLSIIFLLIIGLSLTLLFSKNHKNKYYDKNKSHHTPDGFTNPYIDPSLQSKKMKDFFKLMKEDGPEILEDLDVNIISKQEIEDLIRNEQNFYLWIGHSTALIHLDGKNILTDPIFSDRCSPVQFAGPKRYSRPALEISDLPNIDVIVISHNHYDHLDYKTVKMIGDKALWVVPLGLKKWFSNQGVNNVTELDWHDSISHNDINVTSLPSQHWSKRTVFNSFDTLWSSWLIQVNDFKFWFAGDTGYNEIQFREIGKNYGPFNLAAIPIGAYEPRWFMKNFHINPEEAVKIHKDVFSEKSVGIHFSTFVLTTEPIDEPANKLKQALEKYRIKLDDFLAIKIGEFIFL